jgi:hypothetical protein
VISCPKVSNSVAADGADGIEAAAR